MERSRDERSDERAPLSLETPDPRGYVPAPRTPLGAPPAARTRGSRRRTTLLVLLAAALVLCLAGTITGYVFYDRATRIDRTDPYSAVYQYIDHGFNENDAERAKLFRCAKPDLGPLDALWADLRSREQQFNVTFDMRVANTTTQVTGKTAAMQADLVLQLRGVSPTPQEVQHWDFTFRDEDGWRLCGAKRR